MLMTVPHTQYIKNPEKITKVLENTFVDLLTLFRNIMKVYADKFHLLVNSNEKRCAKIRPYDIQRSEQQKLLRVFIDNKLTFEKHTNNLLAKASQK